jgi:CheY-like chemotaxis protein
MASDPPLDPICRILHIDDSPGDSILLRNVLTEVGYIAFEQAETFEAALALLRANAPDKQISLIILDWHMARMEGAEMLAVLKNDPGLRLIPVIVLTGNTNPSIVRDAYSGHANVVLRKPSTLEGFTELGKAIEGFWIGFAELPYGGNSSTTDA